MLSCTSTTHHYHHPLLTSLPRAGLCQLLQHLHHMRGQGGGGGRGQRLEQLLGPLQVLGGVSLVAGQAVGGVPAGAGSAAAVSAAACVFISMTGGRLEMLSGSCDAVGASGHPHARLAMVPVVCWSLLKGVASAPGGVHPTDTWQAGMCGCCTALIYTEVVMWS
jgi:hypothetical protein